MSKTAISQYSATPSSNSDVDGIDISEGCPASNLNNAQRSLMSHLKEMDDGTSALTSPSMGQLNVDNLRLDGNTISSTDTNGDITIDPAGTGQISLSAPVEVQSTGGATPTYSHTNNGEGLTFRYNDDSGARTADIVAVGNNPAGATMAMRFFTNPASTDAAAEVMRLQDGKVGIGTTAPQQLFHLKSNNPGGKIRLEMGQTGVANGDVTGEIQFYHNDSSGAGVNADIKGICTSGVGAGALTFGTGTTSTTERMRLDSSGNLLVGTTTAEGAGTTITSSQIKPTASGTGTFQLVQFRNDNGKIGTISVSGSSTAYNTSSDYRLKENVTYDWDATTRLKQLKPARFNFIADADTTVDGFLAHEAATVCPESVTGTHNEVEVWKEDEELPDGVSVGDNKLDDDGNTIPVYQGIDQAKLVPLLVKTIQELEARITALEAE